MSPAARGWAGSPGRPLLTGRNWCLLCARTVAGPGTTAPSAIVTGRRADADTDQGSKGWSQVEGDEATRALEEGRFRRDGLDAHHGRADADTDQGSEGVEPGRRG